MVQLLALPLADQWRQLVLGPLSKLDCCDHSSTYLLIVDGLDECEGDNTIQIILQLLAEAQSLEGVRLRIFITSRQEVAIRHSVNRMPQSKHQDFIIQDIPLPIINHNISLFLKYHLEMIGREWTLGTVLNANGLFIWAATTRRFIQEGKRFAVKRLDTILEGSSNAVVAPEKHLDEIYIIVLQQSISPNYTKEEKEELYSMLKLTIGGVLVLLSPLSLLSLSTLLGRAWKDIYQTLGDLHAILDVSEDPNRLLRILHPSFRDFLLKQGSMYRLELLDR
ncbi:MAG: hypothetical protein M1818_001316 [Claussenomyces sp. TS43310]|nr:MAG: hypothetical protein M1818_001316 [Claussenomyces sp. TS43310]